MFFGTYFHQIDAKNRIRIPSKFSKELGSTYVIGRSAMEGTLAIYSKEDFDRISKKHHSPFNKQLEMAYSMFFGYYFEVTEDSQGRLQLTDAIRKLFNLDKNEKDIVFVGAQDHINLMSKSKHEKMFEEMSFDTALEYLNNAYEGSKED